MKYDIIGEICQWNEDRNNDEYNFFTELTMLNEEIREFLDAEYDVDEADALADIIFVAVGSLYKLTGGDSAKVEDILMAVCAANNTKGKDKVNGKITKPKDFVGPEAMIKKILKGE